MFISDEPIYIIYVWHGRLCKIAYIDFATSHPKLHLYLSGYRIAH